MPAVTFDGACALLESALTGTVRREMLAGLAEARDFGHALKRLRGAMRAHTWKAGALTIELDEVVTKYDRRTRQDGFHVLHDWDGKADQVNDDIIPIDVLDYVIARRGAEPLDPAATAILLDYYFLHLLSLLALRIWDEGDADANLDR